jgi:phosphate transport system substrate-binding protein
MTRERSSETVSRRKFLIASGSAGVLGLAGCTQTESGDGGSGGDGGSSGDGGSGDGGSGGDGSEGTSTSNSGGSLSGTIEISGSSTVYPLATAVAELFRQEHPDVEINTRSTGSGGGFANFFCPGQTQFNNASRPIKESEKEQCQSNDVEPVELKVATDALTIIVNPEADFVDCITVEEISQIFGGDAVQKWSDVRDEWPDEEIERYGAAETSGTFDYLTEVMGEDAGHTDDYQATEDDNTIVTGVSGSKYAVGYLGFAYYTSNKDSVKALAIDNGDGCVEPTLETAKGGEYTPLARPLFTYPRQSALGEEHVAEFAKFFVEKSTDRDLVAEKIGYVPNSEKEAEEAMQTLESAIEKANSN